MHSMRRLMTLVEAPVRANHPYENDFFIVYHDDRYVVHTTGADAASKIHHGQFRTGKELNIGERRSAIYFADVNVADFYAHNAEGERYAGQVAATVPVNIKGLKLLNMNYRRDGVWVNHEKYQSFVVHGTLENIPFKIDGTISYLDDGRIYEVCLPAAIANRIPRLPIRNQNK